MDHALNIATSEASASTPALFRLAKLLQHNNVRGAYRILHASRRYWKKCLPIYALSPRISLAVPIGRKEHCWDLKDILGYEKQLIDLFCTSVNRLADVTLFDCGADIGLFSALVCVQCENVRRVLAFEPNPDIQGVFQRNISQLPKGTPYTLAISDFSGFGKLERPTYDSSDHARYLAQAACGIRVETIDSLNLSGGDIAIKIDVEGGELNVIRGAQETIRNASSCVLTLEVHPTVCRRTGVSPAASMEFLDSIRSFHFVVAETGQRVDAASDFTHLDSVQNLVGVTTNL